MGWRTEEAGVERVFWRPRSTNGEMEGGSQTLGRACLNVGNLRTYPPFKISDITSVGDRTVISHLQNICQ